MKPPDAARPGRQPRSQDNPDTFQDSASALATQHRPVTWRELADVLLGAGLALVVLAAALFAVAELVSRLVR